MRLPSKSLRYPSDRSVPQKPYRGLSHLVFDLLSALASTGSSCQSALGTRAQIRDLRIDSRGSLLWAASVTDNFGNRDNLRAGERRSKRKGGSIPVLWGRRGTQAMPIVSVTEVIEVIGYQLWRGVLWPYLAGRLGKYRSFNPENWIRRHIGEAYQDDEPTLEISGIPVCQNDGISVGRYSTCPEELGAITPRPFLLPLCSRSPGRGGLLTEIFGHASGAIYVPEVRAFGDVQQTLQHVEKGARAEPVAGSIVSRL
jgi:hypothetical protein